MGVHLDIVLSGEGGGSIKRKKRKRDLRVFIRSKRGRTRRNKRRDVMQSCQSFEGFQNRCALSRSHVLMYAAELNTGYMKIQSVTDASGIRCTVNILCSRCTVGLKMNAASCVSFPALIELSPESNYVTLQFVCFFFYFRIKPKFQRAKTRRHKYNLI